MQKQRMWPSDRIEIEIEIEIKDSASKVYE